MLEQTQIFIPHWFALCFKINKLTRIPEQVLMVIKPRGCSYWSVCRGSISGRRGVEGGISTREKMSEPCRDLHPTVTDGLTRIRKINTSSNELPVQLSPDLPLAGLLWFEASAKINKINYEGSSCCSWLIWLWRCNFILFRVIFNVFMKNKWFSFGVMKTSVSLQPMIPPAGIVGSSAGFSRAVWMRTRGIPLFFLLFFLLWRFYSLHSVSVCFSVSQLNGSFFSLDYGDVSVKFIWWHH